MSRSYEFTAVTFDWREDPNGTHVLVVHCHEGEGSKLIIKCGEFQRRMIEKKTADAPMQLPCDV